MVRTVILSCEKVELMVDPDIGSLLLRDKEAKKETQLFIDKSGNIEILVNGISQGTTTTDISTKLYREPTKEEIERKESIISKIWRDRYFITYLIIELFKLYSKLEPDKP